ncbi:2-amino-4-hydroxy-6-hydroxymethyldihydropteridine diphosphokinase [Oceanicola sp. 502str15]|uniref:2-amino-4-hydroxy-6- hydroxymethyldihydropteridine diphosphokinase n=1 Tax=Oceanicola sp. 502str15 TaxID=2696061 RepID=UPI00209630B8|nr:2-amino-4-hydroxy-6-hydroxymethyldihydropteridine diphosphokinase [Oceanicola sp. 502str15]MCO6384971.1 2-amino-4-hydroxy-6-hydroxymethyldihydropteridine diphosphokinase [Oceanicola sp. 502str15]
MVTKALFAVGSNAPSHVGSSNVTVLSAISAANTESLTILAKSRLFETPAFPAGAGPDFINAAVVAETTLSPEAVLAHLHKIEADHGRVRDRRWGPRTLDLDLIGWGEAVRPDRPTWRRWARLSPVSAARETPAELILPHPRLAERAFVLVPLLDVAPDWCHPVTGRSVAQMAAALPEAERAAVKPLPLTESS